MKKALYFISVILFISVKLNAECLYNVAEYSSFSEFDTYINAGYEMIYIGDYPTDADSNLAAYNSCTDSNGPGCSQADIIVIRDEAAIRYNGFLYQEYIDQTWHFYYYFSSWVSWGDACYSEPDSDGDGIPDISDLYPNDPTPYKFKIASFYVNDLGKIIPTMVMTDRYEQGNLDPYGNPLNDFFTVREAPQGETEQITIGGVWMNSEDLEDTITQSYDDEDIANFPFDPSPTPSWNQTPSGISTNNDGSITTSLPTTETGTAGSDTDADSVLLKKIADNTSGTTNNIGQQTGYLKDINSGIQKLNQQMASQGSGGVISIDGTAISEGVSDAINEPGETYSDSTTTGLTVPDRSASYTETQNRFTTRFNDFKTTLQNSDLFNIPFTFFENLPTGGNSAKIIDLGYWGGSTMGTFTFDLNDYTVVWDVLKAVLFILSGYSFIKIVVLKHA